MTDLTEIERRFRYSASERDSRSPFTAGLCRSIADDPSVMQLLTAAPPLQQLPVLLLAAVHSLVLAEPTLPVAEWYPSVTDDPRTDDPYPAFAALCHERHGEIRQIVATHSTQTNEVGRCSLFLPPIAQIADRAGPLTLLDVGTSAGLNLLIDRFAYQYRPGGDVGGPASVTLECGVRGALSVPTELPPIVDRLGLDRNPIDVTDPDAVRWLMACVWPDQSDRFHRLAEALAIAAGDPPPIVTGDAVDDLRACIDRLDPAGHPVVINSWVLNYLSPEQRSAYLDTLDAVGSERDLSWVFAEALALVPQVSEPLGLSGSKYTNLVQVQWRGGERTVEHLADCHPHGYWLHWNELSE